MTLVRACKSRFKPVLDSNFEKCTGVFEIFMIQYLITLKPGLRDVGRNNETEADEVTRLCAPVYLLIVMNCAFQTTFDL